MRQSKFRGNTKPNINKTLRSRLKNKANKSCKEEEEEDKRLYNIQRNNVSKLNNKLKKKLGKNSQRKQCKKFLELLQTLFYEQGYL